jgi:antitoxin (DNA-binding transcriptional repressor) of toxin-antitoxin stability system
VDQANAGQAVVITRRGCVVARIVPAVQVAGPLPSRAAVRSAMIKRGAKVNGTTVAAMGTGANW